MRFCRKSEDQEQTFEWFSLLWPNYDAGSIRLYRLGVSLAQEAKVSEAFVPNFSEFYRFELNP